MKKQEARFDKFYNTPPPIAEEMFVSVIMIGCLFGVYELTAFGLSKILKA